MRTKVYKHVITLKSRYFDTTPIGTSTTRTINDIEAINNVFAQGVITITADIITLLAVTGIMLYTSWRLTLIVFITMPFMILATYIFKEKVKISYQKVRTQIANMNAFLQERISGMKTVQIFNAEKKSLWPSERSIENIPQPILTMYFIMPFFFLLLNWFLLLPLL